RDLERKLDALGGPVEVAEEKVLARELGRERREIIVRLILRQDGEGLLHLLDSRFDLAEAEQRAPQARRDTRGRVRSVLRFEQGDRLAKSLDRKAGTARRLCGIPGASEQLGLRGGIVRERRRLVEVALCLRCRGQGGCPFPGLGKLFSRL